MSLQDASEGVSASGVSRADVRTAAAVEAGSGDWRRRRGEEMQMDSGQISSLGRENKDLLDALYRHREILRLETNLLRGEIASRNLATVAGKKAYLKSHSDGRSLSGAPPQLVEQSSVHRIADLPLVSLPYLVPNQEEALDLLLHEAHKLGYRIQSLRKEFSVTVPSPWRRPS